MVSLHFLCISPQPFSHFIEVYGQDITTVIATVSKTFTRISFHTSIWDLSRVSCDSVFIVHVIKRVKYWKMQFFFF